MKSSKSTSEQNSITQNWLIRVENHPLEVSDFAIYVVWFDGIFFWRSFPHYDIRTEQEVKFYPKRNFPL